MFAVALVTLAGLGIVFRISAGIGRQRPRDVVALLDLPSFATDIAFVGPGIDQFALTHDETPLQLFLQENARGPEKMNRIRSLGETRKTSTGSQLSY
ncbi:hypothetical protein SM0020_06427 [Sinorhizobium meliloti CCNWSX0020]|uniref:Uncharacterized protein n=1 Tax=Sinorhizobium meliloti CCNWSX0020 TaxID=1107881 RepID=H0FVS9_RHIML|nr:hypothetical protein SM0020_06427 [Sinorhizobium meliloti CCNWSX0020]